ncbi:hypothetical protein [Spirosoma arboris]|uniref:hypothetical protein n=1 Tax=Spirosoma arboris TaxID=2682092 RepID=UPI001D10957F|nr:hypothetical protein [Spirosoma arboris]
MIKLCFFSISLLFLPGLLVAQGNYVANTASGSSAAPYNTLVGVQAGININSSGQANVFTGYQAGYSTTSGINNVFVGLGTGYNSTVGIQNVAVGHQAGVGSGSNNNNNVSIGFQAGVGSGTVSDAVNIGYMAGHNSTGTFNVFIGSGSGQANISGALIPF